MTNIHGSGMRTVHTDTHTHTCMISITRQRDNVVVCVLSDHFQAEKNNTVTMQMSSDHLLQYLRLMICPLMHIAAGCNYGLDI